MSIKLIGKSPEQPDGTRTYAWMVTSKHPGAPQGVYYTRSRSRDTAYIILMRQIRPGKNNITQAENEMKQPRRQPE